MIHVEHQWEENVRTVEGKYLHRKADQPLIREKRGNKLIVRGLPIHSKELGVSGICDVVEFVKDPDGIFLAGEDGLYQPIPVEYKRGKPKKDESDILQLTAQAMCLEEMLVCHIPAGHLYYHEIKHRVEVPLTRHYRDQVKKYFSEMRHYYESHYTPKVKGGAHCKNCSLHHICLPALMNKKSVSSYIEGKLRQ